MREKELRLRQINRRGFIFGSAALSVMGRAGFAAAKDGARLLVGTQTSGSSKGIYAYSFATSTGDLTALGLAAEAENPTFLALAPDGRTVLVANELDKFEGKDSGAVSTFTLDRTKTRL